MVELELSTRSTAQADAKIRIDLPEKLPCQFDALLPLFGTKGEEVKEKPSAADASSSGAKDTAPPPPVDSDLRDRLLDAIGDLENELVSRYLASRKWIPAEGSFDDLSPNRTAWIINHATEFRAHVQKFANEPF